MAVAVDGVGDELGDDQVQGAAGKREDDEGGNGAAIGQQDRAKPVFLTAGFRRRLFWHVIDGRRRGVWRTATLSSAFARSASADPP